MIFGTFALALALTSHPREVFEAGKTEPVAFWVQLRNTDKPAVPVLMSEWEDLISEQRRMRRVNDEGPFFLAMLKTLLELRMAQLYYFDSLEEAQLRAQEVLDFIARDKPPERVIKRHSDDSNTRRTGGSIGRRKRTLFQYPAGRMVFQHQTGDWVGPVWTKIGAEFYYINDMEGDPDRLDAHANVRFLLIKYRKDDPLGLKTWVHMWRNLSVWSDHPQLQQLLPPALQKPRPAKYGPTDVAPLGSPEQPLTQLSEDPELHGKINEPLGGHRKLPPEQDD